MERLTVGLHPAVVPWAPEIRYVVRTILRISGYSWKFVLAPRNGAGEESLDLYYGPDPGSSEAPVRIRSAGIPFTELEGRAPRARVDRDGLCFLEFDGDADGLLERAGRGATFHNDILLTAFWLLSGALEPTYPRDGRDNLDPSGSFFVRQRLYETPVVSQYAVRLRRLFTGLGKEPSPFFPGGVAGSPALVLTHDVDYPEIVRAVEAVRVLGREGPGRFRRALGVLSGRVDYWRFQDWVEFADDLGGGATFFFMACRGSLLKYAAGTPDAFYDVGSERFRRLFAELVEAGCEIGLHPSYEAYRSERTIRRERCRLEAAATVTVDGVRHHYWHLDPSAPADTLLLQERSGIRYDSTLGFEYYPGFRRGVCHPFRPYHPGERRELDLVELPPTWMDDHFDRRLSENGVEDPKEMAGRLLGAVGETCGAAVLDYHVRGMEGAIYPSYGPWLRTLMESGVATGFEPVLCTDLVERFAEHASRLEERAIDLGTSERREVAVNREDEVEVGQVRDEELSEVAHLHHWFFDQGVFRRGSLASLGPEALEMLFYEPNQDNPYFFCDVARWRGRIIGWSVYATDRKEVFRHPVRVGPLSLAWRTLKTMARNPKAAGALLGNLRYVGSDPIDLDRSVDGWWILLGVRPEYRTKAFERRVGLNVAAALYKKMESRFEELGCDAWYASPRPDNEGIVRFLEKQGAERVGIGRAQGMQAAYYVRHRSPESPSVKP